MKKYQYKSLEGREFYFADRVEREMSESRNLNNEIIVRDDWVFYVDNKAKLRIPSSFLEEPPKEVR